MRTGIAGDGDAARVEYESALAAYEAVRFGRGPRSTEWEAAKRLDRARAAYLGDKVSSPLPPSGGADPRFAWRPPRFEAPSFDASRIFSGFLEIGPALALAVGLTIPLAIFFVRAPAPHAFPASTAPVSRAAATAPPPALTFEPAANSVISRMADIKFTSDVWLRSVDVRLAPDPGVACDAVLETAQRGRISCAAPLPGGQTFVAQVFATGRYTPATARAEYSFKTREKLDLLLGVKWFTEFEDPTAEPLACAAASIRIVNEFTSDTDPMSAEAILRWARPFNRSNDPGLDPVAIATALKQLDDSSNYHYYVYGSREEATKASVYWLLHSAKPVIPITLGGQHAPVIVGYTGSFGDTYSDPTNRIDSVVVLDPQRGDVDPRTARFRADKPRSTEFQTGRDVSLLEWYLDEWWFGFPYAYAINVRGTSVGIDRTDGLYPSPHWAGKFVILVDDGDASHPSHLMGRRKPA